MSSRCSCPAPLPAGERLRLASESYFSPDGHNTGSYTYEYDTQGRRVEDRYFEQAIGGLSNRSVYFYEGDRLASSADYTYGTQLANRVFYQHDQAGNVIREAVYWFPEGKSNRRYEK